MRLYIFEHCFLCFRVRMLAALKNIPLEETVVLEDDTETMMRLVGKRQVPILVEDDGSTRLESMDIVRHLECMGRPLLVGEERPEVARWTGRTAPKLSPLTWPRYPLIGLPELATPSARQHFAARKKNVLGDLAQRRAETREHIAALMPELRELDGMIESADAINGTLSFDDIRVLPMLRSAAVVKELEFPARVRDYYRTMMSKTGHRPLASA